MAVRQFEDLAVWQRARELVRGVYRAAKSQPLKRDFALVGQMKRAAISIPSNIAEGFERGSRRQQIEACYIAKGSAGELRCQIRLARDVELLDEEAFVWLHEACLQVSRMLAAYIRTLERDAQRFPGVKVARQRRPAGDSTIDV